MGKEKKQEKEKQQKEEKRKQKKELKKWCRRPRSRRPRRAVTMTIVVMDINFHLYINSIHQPRSGRVRRLGGPSPSLYLIRVEALSCKRAETRTDQGHGDRHQL